jgi:hypothetical protein
VEAALPGLYRILAGSEAWVKELEKNLMEVKDEGAI